MLRIDPQEDKGGPMFTRPLKMASAQPAAPKPSRLSPAVTAVSLFTLSCAALFLVARPNSAQDLPVSRSSSGAHKTTAASSQAKETVEVAAPPVDLSFYNENIRGNMFSQPVPAAPKPTPTKPQPKPVEPPKISVAPVNPLAGWAYTGTVHMGDTTMAVLENMYTHQGQYVMSGDKFLNTTVKSVDDQTVTLTGADNKPASIAKSDTMTVMQLSQDAPGKNPTPPQQQQNGQQNGQAQNGQQNPANANFSAMGPNGQMIYGDQAQRYQNRLNRGWNRGGGGGNFGSGGGNFGGGGGGRRNRGNGG